MLRVNLTDNLKNLMQSKGINAIDLAYSLSVSPELIKRLEAGELTNPGINTIIGITQYFDIPLEKFVFSSLN